MDVSYVDSPEGITPEQLEGFFIGWNRQPTSATLLDLLQKSDFIVLAKDGERVVGFVTATSDGVLSAYVPFLEVLPEYQSKGIGGELVRRMLAKLEPLYMVDLLCDPELQPFYEKLGMQRATGMMKRNYDKQIGQNSN